MQQFTGNPATTVIVKVFLNRQRSETIFIIASTVIDVSVVMYAAPFPLACSNDTTFTGPPTISLVAKNVL